MYREYFGLREPPFRITPQIECFFSGAQRGALLQALLFAVDNDEGIIAVSGEVGVGKTMLCRMLIEQLPTNVVTVYIANPSLSPEELVGTLSDELGVASHHHRTTLRLIELRLIELFAAGKRVVMIIDEAHAMPAPSLEQVRLFSNLETTTKKLLQIVLFGQPELRTILAAPSMRSLRERITQHFEVTPLQVPDIAEYLDFRMRAAGYRGPPIFSPRVTALIANASRGLIRRINILADKTLLAAFAANTHAVAPKHVRAAIKDANLLDEAPTRSATVRFLCALLAVALIALGAWLVSRRVIAADRLLPQHARERPDIPVNTSVAR